MVIGQAKEITLPQRDERALWERFRAACNAVFEAREAKRKEVDEKKHAGRRALEEICERLETLEFAMRNPRGRAAVKRLRNLMNEHNGGDARVLAVAQTVEDVWEELHPPKTRERF